MNTSQSEPQTVSKDTAGDAARTRRRSLDLVLAGLGLLLCAYLVSPVFQAIHLEGYSAQMQSIALLGSIAPGVPHDPWLPLITQFIFQTRSGIIDMLAAIYSVFPGAGDQAFRMLMVASLAVLLASSIVYAKRWSNTPPLFALFALVLAPGIPETAFFFNDNIVSAALSTAALALVSRRLGKPTALLSGACFGLALLCRLDAVMVLPLIVGTVFYSQATRRAQVTACLLGILGALSLLAASAVFHGFSLIDAFSTAKRFVPMLTESRWVWVRLFFFGLAALPVVLIGGWLGWKRLKNQRSVIGILTFIAYPLLLAAFAPKATEIRYVFPLLAPLIALHGGNGLQWVYQQCTRGTGVRFRVASAVAAFGVLVLLAPLTWVKVLDGPRYVLGRLWSPPQWARWQQAGAEGTRRMEALAALLDDGRRNIVLSSHFNDEFYLRLRLMEHGFLPAATASRYPGCSGMSLFTKGDSVVMHIRAHPQYRIAGHGYQYNAALQLTAAYECSATRSANKTYVAAFGDNDWDLVSEIYSFDASSFPGPAVVRFSDVRNLITAKDAPTLRKFGMAMFRELTAPEVEATRAKARDYLVSGVKSDTTSERFLTIDEYETAYLPVPGPTSALLARLKGSVR